MATEGPSIEQVECPHISLQRNLIGSSLYIDGSSPLTPPPQSSGPHTPFSPMRRGRKHAISPPTAQYRYRQSGHASPTRERSDAGPSSETLQADHFRAGPSRTPRPMSEVLRAQAPTDLGDTQKRARRGGWHPGRKRK